jgi:hypothetical protein
MRSFNRLVVVLAVLLAGQAVQAQPGQWGGMSGGQFRLLPSADADAYYFVVQYAGDAVPDVRTRLYGRALDIRVSRAAGSPGGFFRNTIRRSFRLPPDAAPARMTRRDEPGRVVVVIPRWRGSLTPGW